MNSLKRCKSRRWIWLPALALGIGMVLFSVGSPGTAADGGDERLGISATAQPSAPFPMSARFRGGCPCNGDMNKDGLTNMIDVTIVFNCAKGGDCSGCNKSNLCDVNCDGVVDQADADAVLCLFGGDPPEVCCPAGGVCGDGVLDPGEDCDPPDGGCCDDQCFFAPAGIACGDPTDTDCTDPDTCDGQGTCQDNNVPDGELCTDDGDPCTEDVCLAKVCEHISIQCDGACCDDSIPDCWWGPIDDCPSPPFRFAPNTLCADLNPPCGGGEGEKIYEATNLAIEIPDAGGDQDPAVHTINVPDSGLIADLNIGANITHTWVGDLCVTVTGPSGQSATVIQRMGLAAGCDATGCCGCLEDNLNVILDDEATGGSIEDQCVPDLSSPPNYTPDNPLAIFAGKEKQGDWTITVSDNAPEDVGMLEGWSLNVTNEAPQDCTVNLTIHDGQEGPAVDDLIEKTRGALTVANLNDTDGDGIVDRDETDVRAAVNDRDEIDLMKLVLEGSGPTEKTVLLTLESGSAKVWTESWKDTEVVLPKKYPISALPITLWVEATAPSASLRDIELKLICQSWEAVDTVKATGLWATVTASAHDKMTAADLLAMAEWSGMTNPPRNLVVFYGGVGLRPINANNGAKNVIVIKFKIQPPGIHAEKPAYDGTRQIENKAWTQNGANPCALLQSEAFPKPEELPNDDTFPKDKSQAPNNDDEYFDFDAPGAVSDNAFADLLVFRLNFKEFLRVRIDGVRPGSEAPFTPDPNDDPQARVEVVDGSRCSPKWDWHARHRLTKNAGTGKWERSGGEPPETTNNDIAPGHVPLGACDDSGACCYKSLGYWVCRIMGKGDCAAADQGIFLGPGTKCPKGTPRRHNSVPIIHVANPTKACRGGARGDTCEPGDPIDPWATDPDGNTCHQFDAGPESPPIPADFFEPGSNSYAGQVCLEGEPLGVGPLPDYPPGLDFGQADTLIRRSGDPFDRCDVPSATEVTIEAEVVALNLKSIDPITVVVSGADTLWDVEVDLSGVTPPPGSITAIKTHCNGGTYTSELHVQPRFTFTKVSGPGVPVGSVAVLDTGLEGIDYVVLYQPDPDDPQDPPPPWIHDLPVGEDSGSPVCSDFHPSSEDPAPTTACDCNCNDIRDKCDIEQGAPDVNGNGVPDECEGVCNDDADCCVEDNECTTHACRNPPTGTCMTTYRPRPYGDINPPPANPPATYPCDAEEQARMGDGFLTMLDVMCAFNAMNDGAPFTNCPCADVNPCGGDDFLTMLDVMSIFNTMNDPASAPCPDPCP